MMKKGGHSGHFADLPHPPNARPGGGQTKRGGSVAENNEKSHPGVPLEVANYEKRGHKRVNWKKPPRSARSRWLLIKNG